MNRKKKKLFWILFHGGSSGSNNSIAYSPMGDVMYKYNSSSISSDLAIILQLNF